MKLKKKLLIIITLHNLISFRQKLLFVQAETVITVVLIQANLASKSDIANFVNKIDFDDKLKDVTSNKNELN